MHSVATPCDAREWRIVRRQEPSAIVTAIGGIWVYQPVDKFGVRTGIVAAAW